uniref:Uncharacterized protein n=1 Tax=Romanomermis culicivorax TaxID=13658 RepID=A0A915I5R7_ROMCU
MESEMNPCLGMLTQESITHRTIEFDPSHWGAISPLLSDHAFSKMLIDQQDQSVQGVISETELTRHSMYPNNLREFEAQMKGFAAGNQIFTPYGYDRKFIGIRINRFEDNGDVNQFRIPPECGDPRHAFHIILQLNPNEHSSDLNQLKNFFKKQLSSQGSGKLNTALIKPKTFPQASESIKYEFDGSFPNGVDAHEYKECLPRWKRASGQNCLQANEDDNSEFMFENEDIAKMPAVVKIGKFVKKAIYFQMIKGIIGSAMDGDFARMAKESGILAGMFGMGVAGDVAIQWGRSFLKKNNALKGGAAYLGGKFPSKVYLGFVIADLVARSKAFEMGDKDQLVGIVGDAAILTINVIPLSLEIYSVFFSVGEASIELGPGVMIAEAVIFAAIDGFYASRNVEKINQKLKLSWGEDSVQWTKAFFGAQTSS